MTTTEEKEIMMKKKISIEDDDSYMFEIFDVKNSAERTLTKLVINDTTSFLNISEISSSDFEKFLE